MFRYIDVDMMVGLYLFLHTYADLARVVLTTKCFVMCCRNRRIYSEERVIQSST